jgi:osmotically inducible lipoprotein OsmB
MTTVKVSLISAVLLLGIGGGLSGCAAPAAGVATSAVVGGVAGSALTGGSTAGTGGGAAVGGVVGHELSEPHYPPPPHAHYHPY